MSHDEPVIRVEALGKRLPARSGVLRHTALRNLIGDALRAPLRLLAGSSYAARTDPGSDRQRAGACAAGHQRSSRSSGR